MVPFFTHKTILFFLSFLPYRDSERKVEGNELEKQFV
jgi:hypothetical protein